MAQGDLDKIKENWQAQWLEALALWSRFTKLHEPRWCLTVAEEKLELLINSFAMIRLTDHAVVVSLKQIQEFGLENYPLEIMAHEIGHHVFCPANLSEQGRMLARMRRALPKVERHAPFIANLYADLLINDRLQRSEGLRMSEVFKKLEAANKEDSPDELWTLYMRMYEILWSLQRGTLAKGKITPQLDVDAQLGARVIRVYAKDWLKGSGRFAALLLTYLLKAQEKQMEEMKKRWHDMEKAGAGAGDEIPEGLLDIDPDELEGSLHPMYDKKVTGESDTDEELEKERKKAIEEKSLIGNSQGQYREPFEFGEILKQLGLKLPPHEIAIKYYRERAIPHLVKFPTRVMPESKEPLIEGLDIWDVGSPIEEVDWVESTIVSPHIVPGVTTVQRLYGTASGALPEREPIDLDLYVDCSGSMPNPQMATSYLTLAGTIISLSALRAGARVKATLWSGKDDFQTTGEFIRDEHEILKILTGYIGGWTCFPIHLLRDTFKERTKQDRAVHILHISDDGIDTMFNTDEKGNVGWDVARMALENGRGGGTMVLNLWQDWTAYPVLVRAHKEQGWDVHRVQTWDQLVAFARAFSKAKYGREK